MRYIIGIDLGGTNTVAALAYEDGTIVVRDRTETMANSGFANVVSRMADLVQRLMVDAGIGYEQVEGIGMGVPGYLNMESGVVYFSPNFAGWTDVPLVEEFRKHVPLPVYIVNDVNSHALGEYRFGAGRGAEYVAVLALGTGVGGGLVLGGRLYVGSTEGGGELGHMIVDPDGPRCGCGNYGCLEAFAKAQAIADRAAMKLQQGRRSVIPGMVGGDIRSITPAVVAKAAEAGDEAAIEVWDEVGMYVGIAAAGLIQALSPQVIVIGGGISRAGNLLMDPIRRTVEARSLLVPASTCRLELSPLGDDAGLLGAVSLVIGKR
ncbi:MAG: ROK family protein [bacterium]|nr:ROK family protein [bacterium]